MSRALVAACVLVLGFAATARGGIPCLVDGEGTPLRWTSMPIVYRLAAGDTLNQTAPLVEAGAQVWTDVPTSAVEFAAGDPLLEPIDETNYFEWFGRCGDGVSPVIIDPTGAIIDDAAGEGASEFILGFAYHDCELSAAPSIPEASVVINGRFFGLTSESAQANVTQVIAHELGHVLNLCHVRLHETFVDDGDPANDAFVPLMFPAASGDTAFPDPRPRFDDRAMASLLYPAPDTFATGATLAGHVLAGDRGMPVAGAPVVVRSVTDPLGTAAWTSTGWLKLEGPRGFPVPIGDIVPAVDGAWQASVLPPGRYTVEVERGPVNDPGEFFSGSAESGDPASDPPDLVSELEVAPGTIRTDVTVRLPVRVRSLLSETDWDVSWRASITMRGRRRRLPDAIPPGRFQLLSTGSYVADSLPGLGGSWRGRGKRGFAQQLAPEPFGGYFDFGTPYEVLGVSGRGSADRALRKIRGTIVMRGRLFSPRIVFRARFAYRGVRARENRTPGRVPLVPVQ